jgi:hypothetical protein
MINEEAIKTYIRKRFSGITDVDVKKLGSGVQGAGFLIKITTNEGIKEYVVKALIPEGFGHDYPSDRAGVFLLDLDEFNNLPKHIGAIDVLAEMEDGSIKSIGGGKEYYLLMEKAEGRDYFNDLSEFSHKIKLEEKDIQRIKSMASYLAGIHAVKKDSKVLYWRKLRDTVGHGECLMGVFDLYPDGTVPYEKMKDIIKKSVDWVYKLKPKYKRLSQIHGDFHPGNIWFKEAGEDSSSQFSLLNSQLDFVLLDRSRGPWGEPADDVTALAINYIFFSLKNHGDVRGAYLEGLRLFFEEYINASGDKEINEVVAPFFAFRSAVVANPVFYPDLSEDARNKAFRFTENVLISDCFEVDKVNEYIL